jgi:hypothetical protein
MLQDRVSLIEHERRALYGGTRLVVTRTWKRSYTCGHHRWCHGDSGGRGADAVNATAALATFYEVTDASVGGPDNLDRDGGYHGYWSPTVTDGVGGVFTIGVEAAALNAVNYSETFLYMQHAGSAQWWLLAVNFAQGGYPTTLSATGFTRMTTSLSPSADARRAARGLPARPGGKAKEPALAGNTRLASCGP